MSTGRTNSQIHPGIFYCQEEGGGARPRVGVGGGDTGRHPKVPEEEHLSKPLCSRWTLLINPSLVLEFFDVFPHLF